MANSRAVNNQGIALVRDRLTALGADVTETGTPEIHLLVRYPGEELDSAVAVRAISKPQPGGGDGKLGIYWRIKDSVPADQVAAVDLSSAGIWLFTMGEFRYLAQQHSAEKHQLAMVVEPQQRSKHERYLVEHFEEFRLTGNLRAPAGQREVSAALDDVVSATEGQLRVQLVRHRFRERELRNRKLAAARSQSPDGRLRCEVPGCGFDFEEVYGPVGHGFAQVHHLRPLRDAQGPVRTTLADLAVVCANCHAMIHVNGECRPLASLIQKPRVSGA